MNGFGNKRKFRNAPSARGNPSYRAPWTANGFKYYVSVIPLIHVKDLASIVLHVLDSKPKTRYILAVDQG